jgi:hypothetical protein
MIRPAVRAHAAQRLHVASAQHVRRGTLCEGTQNQNGLSGLGRGDERRPTAGKTCGPTVQVVSSAIGYNPPANAVVAALDRFSGETSRTIFNSDATRAGLYETSAWLFKHASPKPSISPRFANRNNFTEIVVQTDSAGPFKGVPLLRCTIHVRKETLRTEDGKPDTTGYPITIPPLVGPGMEQLAAVLQEEFVDDLKPQPPRSCFRAWCCCCCSKT